MLPNDHIVLCEEKCTMTCLCGAVFEVTVSRQERFEHAQTYACPVCSRLHVAKTCLPPKLSLIIAPAARMPAVSRPAA